MMVAMPLALVRRVIAILAMRVIMVIVRLLMPMIMRVVMIVPAMLIVHMRHFFFQKVRVNVQLGIQVKAPQIKQALRSCQVGGLFRRHCECLWTSHASV